MKECSRLSGLWERCRVPTSSRWAGGDRGVEVVKQRARQREKEKERGS